MDEFRPTHRHRKGGLYRLCGFVRHTETGEELAVYVDANGAGWARPKAVFLDGRFTPLNDDPQGQRASEAPGGYYSQI